MSTPEFTVRYPVFVLKTEEGRFVCLELAADDRYAGGMGLVVFTTESGAAEYLRSIKVAARVRRLDQEVQFRGLVQSADATIVWVVIDPRVNGPLTHMRWAIPRAGFVERYLSEEVWGWDYPVYVLRGWNGYEYFDGYYTTPDEGAPERPLKMVIVLTDADLAEREIAARLWAGCVAVPINSREEFARFVRALPTNIGGAVFDPPTKSGDWTLMTFKLRNDLLTELETRPDRNSRN